ncbi:MAG: hypothetical protein MPW14_16890 [Candidatus Manganitrophus sp.]|nr:hypothetical protein [Candidatus Manganitrophus sp.]WDT73378.1 MAG: hypothetical protein MPW17_12275 [Candidatus Manganitrophus sp.]WDT82679.1 MAG: hypothetical protein MPW14_16890 [Candidatus Manganitrophus sp.]
MKLNDWLTLFSTVAVSGKTDLEIGSIASDSRKVAPGGFSSLWPGQSRTAAGLFRKRLSTVQPSLSRRGR